MKKELKKCGFTLIEVLAVIVVLAVIALITTPIILNVMEKAKKGALEDSAYGLLESANLYYAEGTLENNQAKTEFTFKDGIQTSENKLSYKGKVENGSVRLYSDGKSALCITEGNYAAIKNVNDKKVSVVKGKCSYNTETEEYETNDLCQDLKEENEQLKDQIEEMQKMYAQKLATAPTITCEYNTNVSTGTVSSVTVNIKELLPTKYQTLTADNFIITYSTHIELRSSNLNLSNMGENGLINTKVMKAYNAETGMLTLSAYVMNHYAWGYVYYKDIDIYLK